MNARVTVREQEIEAIWPFLILDIEIDFFSGTRGNGMVGDSLI